MALRWVRKLTSWARGSIHRGNGHILDALIVVAVAIAVSLPFVSEPSNVTMLGAFFNAGTVLPLLWRRRAPFAVAVTVFAFAIGVSAHHRPGQYLQYGGLVAIYTVADRGKNWQRWVFFWIVVLTFPPASLWLKDNDAGEFVFTVFLPVTAFLLGTISRTSRERVRALGEYAEQLELARKAEAARAVAQERSRITRDMHDVLAHAVSIIVVQAEAGPLAVRSDPARAERAFGAIADSGREAMSQLRTLLGLLKDDETNTSGFDTQPSIARIIDLLTRVEEAGINVKFTVTGSPRSLPTDVEVAGYRIAQEALTNTLKHAKANAVIVNIQWLAEAVTIAVVDDGVGPPRTDNRRGGHGLIGMRERAAACRGSVAAGPGTDGGFSVTARLPYSTSRTAEQQSTLPLAPVPKPSKEQL